MESKYGDGASDLKCCMMNLKLYISGNNLPRYLHKCQCVFAAQARGPCQELSQERKMENIR